LNIWVVKSVYVERNRWELWLNDEEYFVELCEVKKMNLWKTSKLVQITLMKAIDSEDELTPTLNITWKTCWSAFPIKMFTWPNFSINLLQCISYKNVYIIKFLQEDYIVIVLHIVCTTFSHVVEINIFLIKGGQ